ncbi:MAG: hypothetical protein V1874_11270 [Spirochaetota bacterium]
MPINKIITILFITLFFLKAQSAYAFNGFREGFILGGAVGGGLMRYDRDTKDRHTETANARYAKAFALDIMIGYGLTNKFLIYYNNKELWISSKKLSGEKAVFVNSMGPLGISYYFNDGSPSFFLSLGAGFAHFYAPFEKGQELDYGHGLYAGAGYEFSGHYGLNINYMFTKTRLEEDGTKTRTNSHSVFLTFSAICY